MQPYVMDGAFDVPPPPDRNEKCPCGSGRKYKKCGRIQGWEHPQPSITTPPGAASGLSNPQCYAKALADCCEKTTREHYSTEGVLRSVAADQPVIRVSGLSFQSHGEVRELPPDAICSKSLCKRHNEALSGIDSCATALAAGLSRIIGLDSAVACARQFSGADVEKWLVKKLLGRVWAERGTKLDPKLNYGNDGQLSRLAAFLFSDAYLTPPAGMWVRVDGHGESATANKLEHGERYFTSGGLVTGALTRLHTFEFLLWLVPGSKPPFENYGHFEYRPTFLKSTGGFVELRWPGRPGVHWTDIAIHRERTQEAIHAQNRRFPWGHPSGT